jgi:hypothetical protein
MVTKYTSLKKCTVTGNEKERPLGCIRHHEMDHVCSYVTVREWCFGSGTTNIVHLLFPRINFLFPVNCMMTDG